MSAIHVEGSVQVKICSWGHSHLPSLMPLSGHHTPPASSTMQMRQTPARLWFWHLTATAYILQGGAVADLLLAAAAALLWPHWQVFFDVRECVVKYLHAAINDILLQLGRKQNSVANMVVDVSSQAL